MPRRRGHGDHPGPRAGRRPRYGRRAVQLLRTLGPEPEDPNLPAGGHASQAGSGVSAAAGVPVGGVAGGRGDRHAAAAAAATTAGRCACSACRAVGNGTEEVGGEQDGLGDSEGGVAGAARGPGPPAEAEKRPGVPPGQASPLEKKNKKK